MVAIGTESGSQSLMKACPRWSNLTVIGSVRPFGTIETSLRPARLAVRTSWSPSRPSLSMSIISENEFPSIVTPDMSEHTEARRFTESNLARSRLILNSRAMFCRFRLLPDDLKLAIAKVTSTATTARTITTSIIEMPLSFVAIDCLIGVNVSRDDFEETGLAGRTSYRPVKFLTHPEKTVKFLFLNDKHSPTSK